ncbi:hypothetical protein D3C77_403370 [compost metagenome]
MLYIVCGQCFFLRLTVGGRQLLGICLGEIVACGIFNSISIMHHHVPIESQAGFFGVSRALPVHFLLNVFRHKTLAILHYVIDTFNAPVHQNLPFFGSKVVQKLDSCYRIFAFTGYRYTISAVKAC